MSLKKKQEKRTVVQAKEKPRERQLTSEMSVVGLLSEEGGSEWGRKGEKEERSEVGTVRERKGQGNRGTEGRRQ